MCFTPPRVFDCISGGLQDGGLHIQMITLKECENLYAKVCVCVDEYYIVYR